MVHVDEEICYSWHSAAYRSTERIQQKEQSRQYAAEGQYARRHTRNIVASRATACYGASGIRSHEAHQRRYAQARQAPYGVCSRHIASHNRHTRTVDKAWRPAERRQREGRAGSASRSGRARLRAGVVTAIRTPPAACHHVEATATNATARKSNTPPAANTVPSTNSGTRAKEYSHMKVATEQEPIRHRHHTRTCRHHKPATSPNVCSQDYQTP
ncbi:hypothetical protein TNCT_373451 [Trichonephila clavata]|uniref:Uncharacterized protein n=1 Tax=Trichonephila clavata TaxID=2740835 RepID=A0A8X6FFX0_TRICU|nr:hypothetical protein TNCT_373451 [Trichonephila clavata]